MYGMNLPHDKGKWWAVVSTVMNLAFSEIFIDQLRNC